MHQTFKVKNLVITTHLSMLSHTNSFVKHLKLLNFKS
jgi:hypothetical protein